MMDLREMDLSFHLEQKGWKKVSWWILDPDVTGVMYLNLRKGTKTITVYDNGLEQWVVRY